jgi:hypothetical protein
MTRKRLIQAKILDAAYQRTIKSRDDQVYPTLDGLSGSSQFPAAFTQLPLFVSHLLQD